MPRLEEILKEIAKIAGKAGRLIFGGNSSDGQKLMGLGILIVVGLVVLVVGLVFAGGSGGGPSTPSPTVTGSPAG